MDIQQRNHYRNLRRIDLYKENLDNKKPKRGNGKAHRKTIMDQQKETQSSQLLSRRDKSPPNSKTTSQNSHHSPVRQQANSLDNNDYRPKGEQNSRIMAQNQNGDHSKARSRIPKANRPSAETQNGRNGNHGNYERRQSEYYNGGYYEESEDSYDYYSPSPKAKDIIKREKIETELRNNRITETKIKKIAARISQSYNTDEENYTIRENGLERHLRRIVSNSLDPMLYRSKGHTNVNPYHGDVEELVKKVTTMIKQLQGDLEACYSSILTSSSQVDEGSNRIRSIPQIIQQEVQELQTDYDVLYDKFKALSTDLTVSVGKERETSNKAANVTQQNTNLDKEIKRIKAEWTTMAEDYTKVKANEKELKEKLRETEEEREKFEKKYVRVKEVNNVITDECNKLTDENIRLNQETDNLDREVKRLAEPDKKMMQKIQRLEHELVELKTANRRLENEKGLIRGSLMKLESNYDLVQKDKKALTKERNKFWKENQELRTQNRKLTLSH